MARTPYISGDRHNTQETTVPTHRWASNMSCPEQDGGRGEERWEEWRDGWRRRGVQARDEAAGKMELSETERTYG